MTRLSAGRRKLTELIDDVETGVLSADELLDWFDHYQVWKGPDTGPRGGRPSHTVYRIDVTKYKPFLMGRGVGAKLTEAILEAARKALAHRLQQDSAVRSHDAR